MAAITTTANGVWSAAGTWTGGVPPTEGDTCTINHIVTIDQNITVGADNGTAAIQVAATKTLQVLSDVAASYTLILKANMQVAGIFNIGTVANPIPSDKIFTIRMNYSATLADGKYGVLIQAGGTCIIQGATVVDRCLLNTDEAAAQTVLGVDKNTGWVSGQLIGIASTTRTYSQCEKRTVASSDATTVTVTAGLTNAHSGTVPTQAEVIMLTRNIVITAYTAASVGYISFATTATVDIDWCEFSYLGEDATGKRGLDITTTTGTCNIQNCSLYDFEDRGVYISGTTANKITFSNSVCYNLASLTNIVVNFAAATSGTTITFDNNIVMLAAAATNYGFYLADIGGSFTNNTVVGINGMGIAFGEVGVTSSGTFSGNTVHSCATIGMNFSSWAFSLTIPSSTVWRCNSYGLSLPNFCRNLSFPNLTVFGNLTANIALWGVISNITFESLVSSGDSTFATTNGILDPGAVVLRNIYLYNADFSTAAGIKVKHTNDINIAANTHGNYILSNCKMGGTNEVANNSNLLVSKDDFVKSTKHNQTTGAALIHKSWFKYGTIITDLVIFNTAVPSMRLTPNNASFKLESGSFKVNVNSGQKVTPSVYVRKSTVVSGGALYNGAQPRLILKRNDAIGITADEVIATMTEGATANWEQLTAAMANAATEDGVAEFVIDCDGTVGFVNVDDFSATVA